MSFFFFFCEFLNEQAGEACLTDVCTNSGGLIWISTALLAYTLSRSSWIPHGKITKNKTKKFPAVWAADQPNQVALLVSRASVHLKCLLSQTSFCLLRCPLGYCLFTSTFSCFSPSLSPGLHGPLKPLLLHRSKCDSATQRNSIKFISFIK